MNNTTICAISTPIGTGGISIIRLSGDNALSIATKVFSSKNIKDNNIKPRYFYLGTVDTGDIQDKCMMVYFRSPYSYTGEDLVELQCHGGVLITSKVVQALCAMGATIAQPGEFTKRAFVNGKLSLDEAEGVIDTINAESDSELKASHGLTKGYLHKEIVDMQSTLTDILSEINVTFDFPENDDEEITSKQVLDKLTALKGKLSNIIATADTGLKLKSGNQVVIVGKPNVGKSSIMNAMLGLDRAIVTSVQGTTRDVLQETYVYKGVRFVLTDTAGLHDSTDIVESIGIDKAKEYIDSADIILYTVDSSTPLDKYDDSIIKLIKNKKVIVLLNKSDLPCVVNPTTLPFDTTIQCSALNKSNIDKIKDSIFNLTVDSAVLSSNIIITNARHKNALDKALNIINKVLDDLQDNKDLELVSLNLQDAWTTLGEITGVSSSETIVNNIFSKFCVGK